MADTVEPTEPVQAPVTATASEPAVAPTPEPPVETPEAPKPAPAKTFADLLSDPAVARELAARQKKAVEEAVAAARAEEETKRKREKMDEAERLKADLEEASGKVRKAESEKTALKLEVDFASAFMKSGKALVDANAVDFVKAEARKLMESDGLPMEACINEVFNKHAYLIAKAEPVTAAPVKTAVARPSTSPTTTPQTEAPAEKPAPEAVDTRSMTPQEYREYKRRVHNI